MASGRESGRGGIGILSLISALALLAFLFTLAFSRSGDSSPDSKTSADLATQKKSGRLAAYCYEERSRGAEGGHSSIPPSWKLVHAVVNLRHGDRTSIHNLGERLVSLSLTLSLLYISPSLPLSVSVCLSLVEKTSVQMAPDASVTLDRSQFQGALETIASYQLKPLAPKRWQLRTAKPRPQSNDLSPLKTLFETQDRYSRRPAPLVSDSDPLQLSASRRTDVPWLCTTD
jgi:hypothetical protein